MKSVVCAAIAVLAAVSLCSCGDDSSVKAPAFKADAGGVQPDGGLDAVSGDDVEATDLGVTDLPPAGLDAAKDATAVDAAADVSAPMADSTGDALAPDVGPSCPGEVGCPCALDADCPSLSACSQTASGKQCLAPCTSDLPCADGTTCISVPTSIPGGDPKALCAPKWPNLCNPCSSSATCSSTGVPGGACVSAATIPGAEGWYCGTPCKNDKGCPKDFWCLAAATIEGGTDAFCVPTSGTCGCGAVAMAEQLTTTCASVGKAPDGSDIVGCKGVRGCTAAGLGACSAPVLSAEVCDAQDNDCNGLTDDAPAGIALCDDSKLCTSDVCQSGVCLSVPNTATCDDGDACTSGDACNSLICMGKVVDCNDSNPCTADACAPASGCSHTPNAAPCDDGNPCTTGDTCAAGQCASGAESNCPCKVDSDCAASEDGDLCNGTLYCDKKSGNGVCKVNPATVVVCDPTGDTVCHAAVCDKVVGKCQPSPQGEGKACDDGSACTTSDACQLGQCVGGGDLSCEDGNVCTDDTCLAKNGCMHTANSAPCKDADICTVAEVCADSACTTKPLPCDDGYACTLDSCGAAKGCLHTPSADPSCGIVKLPYQNKFICEDASLALWQRSDTDAPSGTVRWETDATPAVPGFNSAACSINVNNGKDLTCGVGQIAILATADSPWIDATALAAGGSISVSFASSGSWSAGQKATVQARLSGGDWSEIAVVTPGVSWQPVKVASSSWAGKVFQIRLLFAGTCGSAADVGWFVDDFAVAEDKCAIANGGCPDGYLCSVAANGAVICTSCPAGYKLDAGACVDIDECAVPTNCAAAATCTNTPGSYACACKSGYTGDGKTCSDINECAAVPAPCSPAAICANTPGAYTCTCTGGTFGDGKTCGKKGTQANPALSCLEILSLYPGSADGSYWLDIDGSGPAAPAAAYCDMKNGGWTLLIWDDFEDSTIKNWSAGSVTTCGKYGKILGGYNVFGAGAIAQKTVAQTPAHSEYKLTLSYIYIDTWDDEWAQVRIDGNEVWSHQHNGNGWGSNQCGNWLSPEDQGAVAVQKAHTAASITVAATSTLDSPASDESFAIDNVALWVR